MSWNENKNKNKIYFILCCISEHYLVLKFNWIESFYVVLSKVGQLVVDVMS